MLFSTALLLAATTGFNTLIQAAMADAKPLYTDFCQEIESANSQETFVIPESFGEMQEHKGELKVKPAVVWSQTIKNLDWESSFEVPRNAFEDAGKLGIYDAQAKMLGMAAATHPDSLMYDTLVGGFSQTVYDGQAFFSASHPRGNGLAAQSNLVSGALSATTFRTALAQLQSMTDYYGKPLRMAGTGAKLVLMVGPSNRATAQSIVALATTSSGAGNPDFGAAEVRVNEYFVGDKAGYWFLAYVGGPVKPLILQKRQAPVLHVLGQGPDDPEVVKYKRVLFSMQGRWNMGFGLYQLIQGSTGA